MSRFTRVRFENVFPDKYLGQLGFESDYFLGDFVSETRVSRPHESELFVHQKHGAGDESRISVHLNGILFAVHEHRSRQHQIRLAHLHVNHTTIIVVKHSFTQPSPLKRIGWCSCSSRTGRCPESSAPSSFSPCKCTFSSSPTIVAYRCGRPFRSANRRIRTRSISNIPRSSRC